MVQVQQNNELNINTNKLILKMQLTNSNEKVLDVILKMIRTTPNDMILGSKIRETFSKVKTTDGKIFIKN
jgi:hypothetical protein